MVGFIKELNRKLPLQSTIHISIISSYLDNPVVSVSKNKASLSNHSFALSITSFRVFGRREAIKHTPRFLIVKTYLAIAI
jgi:hypothetical protein